LSNITGKFNWCAYVSDYPPNILDYIDGAYTLRGTPPFTLKDANGNTQIVTGTTITQSSLTITPITMTDETGYPGYFCKYVSMDLFMNASYPCQPRTSGAQNWEAWIKDSRDEELYRIVFMPDNKWWLAQNVKYAGAGSSITVSGCTKDKCGRWYSFVEPNASYFGGTSGVGKYIQGVCPNGWMLPHDDDWSLLVNSLDPDVTIAQSYLMADDSPCLHTNSYGWATPHMMHRKNHTDWGDSWYSNGPVKSTVGRLCCPRYYAYDDWRQTPWEDIGDERRVRCFHLL
jgi:uncharacterized protein (TIGR02145 family)